MNAKVATRLDFKLLKTKQRRIRAGFPESFGLRAHRCVSWIGRAEAETEDPAAAFIFLWIAFNAAYADERDFRGQRDAFGWFFGQLSDLDSAGRIYDAVWSRFSGPIRLFLENPFVFSPFWSHQNGIPGYEDWNARFEGSKRVFHTAVVKRDTVKILSMLFDRLYVLRNQIVHGGATWNSSTNRNQLRDGSAILSCLVPIMIDIMMDNPDCDWGRPFYPVVSVQI